ncbi:uncharacterized protein DUF5996 [Staphylococcus auricularis]|uniref:DUF5996 family protein n=1 Tax=Staphylococcus auricularis TaxID=29379 RepID=UPI0019320A91|nr:DUF5996 family protein [Staphylococcus auricularis]MBM0869081.1 hypothetical protein [Staphylococcus auricularis]MCG7340796.1 DUF5996 family protein [Staphylococcus auricularis]
MLLEEWKQEKETMHLLSQILGKYKLEAAYQQPQWAHVPLDITVQGFTTGMLHCEDKDFSITVNLLDDEIEIRAGRNKSFIPLENGTTIKDYYEEIRDFLKQNGVTVEINTTPQEFEDTTPFEQDTTHHHYDSEISNKALDIMKFAYHAESTFIASLRTRKFQSGLFWGTFDISSAIINNVHRPFEDDDKVIERAAFDEEMIEFGFWFGDDQFKGPTFFVMSYPFAEDDFECHEDFPDGSYFDGDMGEFLLEVSDYGQDTVKSVEKFLYESYNLLQSYLNWEDCDHFHLPLKMRENHLD